MVVVRIDGATLDTAALAAHAERVFVATHGRSSNASERAVTRYDLTARVEVVPRSCAVLLGRRPCCLTMICPRRSSPCRRSTPDI